MTAAPEDPPVLVDPAQAPAHAAWIRPLSAYERRETTFTEGNRHG